MSAAGSASPPQDVMRTYMLRSNTPASNEKVLLYLEGMARAPPGEEENDAASSKLLSPVPRNSNLSSARHLEELAEEGVDYGDEDVRSDVQEMPRSEAARTIVIQSAVFPEPEHEPGPNDPPHIRPGFESYGSSWGNMGPLRDSFQADPNNIPSPIESHPNPFQQYGMAPVTVNAAAVPLPTSMLSGGNGNGIDPPLSPTARSRATGSPSKAPSNGVASPKAPSRVLSPTRTGNGGGSTLPTERPWSPRSNGGASQVKSRVTQKSSRTQYPPLPESVAEEATQRAVSPPARTHNRSPSITPSESASQYKPRTSSKLREASHKPSKSMKSITEVQSDVRSQESPKAISPASRVTTSQKDARSQAPMSPRSQASQRTPLKAPSNITATHSELKAAASVVLSPVKSNRNLDPEATPTQSRATSPVQELNPEEQKMIQDVLLRPAKTRTSYAASAAAPSMLEPEVQNSHFHDMELCQLLHALDQPQGEPVKRAVRKAVRARVKKLGMKYDNESIRQYRKSYHDHDPLVHMALTPPPMPTSKRSTQLGSPGDAPEWAKEIIDGMINMRERLDILAPKIEKSLRSSRGGGSYVTDGHTYAASGHHNHYSQSDVRYTQSPLTQTTQMLAGQQTGTMADESMFQGGETDVREFVHARSSHGSVQHHEGEEEGMYEEDPHHLGATDADTGRHASEYNDREASPGQQYLEEELYKLRIKPTGSQSAATHKTWELARNDGDDFDDEDGDVQAAVTESGLPEIPDGNTGAFTDHRATSPPLPPVPHDREHLMHEHQIWHQQEYASDRGPPPWQRVHQRLLSWAIVWPILELDKALNSTTRGMQVDEIALSIWSTQTYKRYVRSKMTDSPPGRVDRLFVPPNMADAISTAVYNGRHGDACGMLRDLWAPFGLEGIPRLLVVLAKHRSDENHWVVHRFSLPDGSLTTYDTYPERCLPDGRPLGWWFAIRIAWPDAIYPSPDHLMQKMVRLHRPMQLGIDNSVAAAGIWRNLLMGSRAERSLDLERLRDLINTEVKNLRQRKQMGKLSIGSPRPHWEDMH